MNIRLLTPEDAAAFQALRLRGLGDVPTAFASSFEEECDTPVEDVAHRLRPKSTGALFGAWDDGRLVGVVGVEREGMRKLQHKATLWGMYVCPEARRSGVASGLIATALNYAWTTLKVAQVNLGVHTDNAAAIALYGRFGFVIWGTEVDALVVNGTRQDEYYMACRAPAAA